MPTPALAPSIPALLSSWATAGITVHHTGGGHRPLPDLLDRIEQGQVPVSGPTRIVVHGASGVSQQQIDRLLGWCETHVDGVTGRPMVALLLTG